jgi:hypothetical protein
MRQVGPQYDAACREVFEPERRCTPITSGK